MIVSRPRKPIKLALAIALCQSAGGIGAIATSRSVNTWYRDLEKPGFNPPGWVFGPAWTVLYTLMGVALYLVSESTVEARRATRGRGDFRGSARAERRLDLPVLWAPGSPGGACRDRRFVGGHRRDNRNVLAALQVRRNPTHPVFGVDGIRGDPELLHLAAKPRLSGRSSDWGTRIPRVPQSKDG